MTGALTNHRLWALFRPLALSWLFMAVEGPVAIGVLGRLPNAAVNMAGLLILFAVAMWIESPVIDLLSTSTALSRGRQSWASVQRYAWAMGAIAVGCHALVAVTPLYNHLIEGVLRVPVPVSEAVRPAFLLMTPWSAFIGWRRVRQGVLISSGETRIVGRGTAVRMVTMIVGTSILGFVLGLSGIQAAAGGLLLSVAAEAVFVHLASRQSILALQAVEDQAIPWAKLANFHVPLALTTMVNMIASPIIAAGLSQAINPVVSLAAYEVMSSCLFILRAPMFALPEVVIATYKAEEDRTILSRFAATVGVTASLLVLIVSLSGLAERFFAGPMHATPEVAQSASIMLLACSVIPLLEAAHSYLAGLLSAKHRTASRVAAVVGGVAAMVAVIAIAIRLGWSDWAMGSVAKSAGIAAEAAILGYAWLRISRLLRGPAAA